MHPRVREIVEYLEARRVVLRIAVETVEPDRRRQRPAPDSWSVAEVLEHLALVETRVTALFVQRLAEARSGGLAEEHDHSSLFTSFDLKLVADRSRRILTTEAGVPSGALDADEAWAQLSLARDATLAALRGADGLALGDVVAAHHLLGPMNLYQWMLFLGAHEDRHAAQIRAVAKGLPPAPFE
ncbi:MAG TPA: DinB family protein [Luteitalea sp.]|nr:DinB family protein [Luteitalea sp.]